MASKRRSRSRSPINLRDPPIRDRERFIAGFLPNTIDRQSTCPLLLRVFCNSNGRHHRSQDFSSGKVPADELQIYTWMDCTLKELMSLVHEVNPDTRQKGTIFSFATVFPYHTGNRVRGSAIFRIKDIGVTTAGKRGQDDNCTLSSQKFQIGDYIDIAISIKRPDSGKKDRDRGKRKDQISKS
ncbi:Histone deacetylase complex subunit SAP18-like [Oopsacas minuta]|uniref:18 kDa Sin3-associated polypeptide n=1 Tax=Oopsacas minuta TaxID=111878 RepID=A0AAV7KL95_9METZ|nr:Histone deacetylase complex subunit SAP18-like [Oopsacas minuta]